ncbi:hypothetical protein FACS189494_08110 [Spirochaetia bacterium]|nr:hypothetical protein FACS189494_08110 [Spirochaetia bacterium]
MGVRDEVFSTRVQLQNRTYFFNVKENRKGDLYLNMVESKNSDGGGFERQSIVIFADDLQEVLKGFDESLRFLEKSVHEKKKARPARPRNNDNGEHRAYRPRDNDNGEHRAYRPRNNENGEHRAYRPRDNDNGEHRTYRPRNNDNGEHRAYRSREGGDRGDRPERPFKKFEDRGERGGRAGSGRDRPRAKKVVVRKKP